MTLAGNRRQPQVSLEGLEEEVGVGATVARPTEAGMQVARRAQRRKKVSKSESSRGS